MPSFLSTDLDVDKNATFTHHYFQLSLTTNPSMLPRSGRSVTGHISSDAWDAHVPKPPNTSLPAVDEDTTYNGAPRVTSDTLVQTFAHSNAVQALTEESAPFGHGRNMLVMQNKHSMFDPHNTNILPMSTRVPGSNTTDEHYLGNLGVETQFKAGTMVDRLGNEYDIWESELPPPDKDYSSIAPASSQRHLERCMGADPNFYDRPKKEVTGLTNPAEPRGDDFYKEELQNVAELHGRDTFFNQSGMQQSAAIDTGRDNLYSGYNMKTEYSKLVHPVQHCWRATQVAEVHATAEPVAATGSTLRNSQPTTRKEQSSAFSRSPNKTAVSVRPAMVALPFLPAASLRARHAPATRIGAGGGAEAATATAATDHVRREHVCTLLPTRPTMASTLRSNPAVEVHTHSGVADHDAGNLSREGPAQLGARSGADHVTGDDSAIDSVSRTAMLHAAGVGAPREAVDHVVGEQRYLPSARAEGAAIAAGARPAVASGQSDHAAANQHRTDHAVCLKQADPSVTRIGRPDVAQTYAAKQQLSAQHSVHAAVAAAEQREMHDGAVNRGVPLAGGAVNATQQCLPNQRQNAAHCAAGSADLATPAVTVPIVSAERTSVAVQLVGNDSSIVAPGARTAATLLAAERIGAAAGRRTDNSTITGTGIASSARPAVAAGQCDYTAADQRRADQSVFLQPTPAGTTRVGRADIAQTYVAKQQLSTQQSVPAAVVADEQREMHSGEAVERGVPLVGGAVNATQQCLPTQRQHVAHCSSGSAGIATSAAAVPMVSIERTSVAVQPMHGGSLVAPRTRTTVLIPPTDRTSVAARPVGDSSGVVAARAEAAVLLPSAERTHVAAQPVGDSSGVVAPRTGATVLLPSAERTHVAAQPVGDSSGVVAPRARTTVLLPSAERTNVEANPRSNSGTAAGARTRSTVTLPVTERSCVAARPVPTTNSISACLLPGYADTTESSSRGDTERTALPTGHAPVSMRTNPLVHTTHTAEFATFARTGQMVKEAAAVVHGVDDRPAPSRVSHRVHAPIRASNQDTTAHVRVMPVASQSTGGSVKNTRLDAAGPAASATSRSYVRSATRLAGDRSSPAPRSLTPSMQSTVRWAPAVQVAGTRDVQIRNP